MPENSRNIVRFPAAPAAPDLSADSLPPRKGPQSAFTAIPGRHDMGVRQPSNALSHLHSVLRSRPAFVVALAASLIFGVGLRTVADWILHR